MSTATPYFSPNWWENYPSYQPYTCPPAVTISDSTISSSPKPKEVKLGSKRVAYTLETGDRMTLDLAIGEAAVVDDSPFSLSVVPSRAEIIVTVDYYFQPEE